VAGKKSRAELREVADMQDVTRAIQQKMLTSQWITKATKFGRYDKKSYLREIKPKNCTKK
jgi:hypothetical protein